MKLYAKLYFVGAMISWLLIAGMLFADLQGSFPRLADEHRRKDVGFSVILGAGAALVWPVGLPFVYCLTGFAEHGIWQARQQN